MILIILHHLLTSLLIPYVIGPLFRFLNNNNTSSSSSSSSLPPKLLLSHVAFIMDGNRRYARGRGVQVEAGHSQGFQQLQTVKDMESLGGFLSA